MWGEKVDASNCFLIDKEFCRFTQKKIAVVMGMATSIKDEDLREEMINELADIRSFFNRKELREYSDTLKDSIDMERFIDPSKPIVDG